MIKLMLACFVLSLSISLAACRGGSGQNGTATAAGQEKLAPARLDSLANDLENTTKTLETQMTELKVSLDSI